MVELYSSPWEDLKFFPVGSYLQELLEMIRPLPELSRIPAPILALLSTGITYTDPQITRTLLAENPRDKNCDHRRLSLAADGESRAGAGSHRKVVQCVQVSIKRFVVSRESRTDKSPVFTTSPVRPSTSSGRTGD